MSGRALRGLRKYVKITLGLGGERMNVRYMKKTAFYLESGFIDRYINVYDVLSRLYSSSVCLSERFLTEDLQLFLQPDRL